MPETNLPSYALALPKDPGDFTIKGRVAITSERLSTFWDNVLCLQHLTPTLTHTYSVFKGILGLSTFPQDLMSRFFNTLLRVVLHHYFTCLPTIPAKK